MKPLNKNRHQRNPNNLKQKQTIRFGTVSPNMLFRAFILFCAILVAALALILKAENAAFWSFLGNVLIYAALTNNQKAQEQDSNRENQA